MTVQKIVYRFWSCSSGQVISIELILLSVVVLIGLIVGGSAIRDSVVSEYNDSVLSVQNSNQSFSYFAASSSSATTAGSDFGDASDSTDGEDVADTTPGISFSTLPSDEGDELDLESLLESLDFQFRMTRGTAVWTGDADFSAGDFSASTFWPGEYSITGDTVTIVLDPLGGGWNDGEIVLDASDPFNLSGMVTWINENSGAVWEAVYELFGM